MTMRMFSNTLALLYPLKSYRILPYCGIVQRLEISYILDTIFIPVFLWFYVRFFRCPYRQCQLLPLQTGLPQ